MVGLVFRVSSPIKDAEECGYGGGECKERVSVPFRIAGVLSCTLTEMPYEEGKVDSAGQRGGTDDVSVPEGRGST